MARLFAADSAGWLGCGFVSISRRERGEPRPRSSWVPRRSPPSARSARDLDTRTLLVQLVCVSSPIARPFAAASGQVAWLQLRVDLTPSAPRAETAEPLGASAFSALRALRARTWRRESCQARVFGGLRILRRSVSRSGTLVLLPNDFRLEIAVPRLAVVRRHARVRAVGGGVRHRRYAGLD